MNKTISPTSLTVAEAARILSASFKRRIDEEQVLRVVEEADLLRADGTFSLIDYVAFLAGEVSGGRNS